MRTMVRNLFLLHLLLIILTLPVLYLGRFSSCLPFLYVLVLFLMGLLRNRTMGIPPLTVLAAGYLSQLPGIIPGFFILTEDLWPFGLEVFEFIAQIWQTPLYPLYPLLPHAIYHDIPLYFLVTVTASFIIPLIPAAGAWLSYLVKKMYQPDP
ncbi:MAG TPA: hypothetical protein GX520_07735 [Syntrophaceticus sp.]|nr:hypothetical protein [Syntrophaceticus schinkii]MDD4261178.1 hypothetical protein [Syntrophaceticus schinkii]MDD4674330.1 hypothetical protein [Syntrophaceticus schinkii]HHY30560.1 hypothetical protein [Syntrophaceticus sp.]